MENGKYAVDFFLGANTPQGFVSRFDQLADPADGWRKFILKGGPGTGKSGLMKRLAAELSHRCNHLELIHCASDINSLDAVIVPDIKASIADGTAPHERETDTHKKPAGQISRFLNCCTSPKQRNMSQTRCYLWYNKRKSVYYTCSNPLRLAAYTATAEEGQLYHKRRAFVV
ncbi:hypothetical protein [Hydrogenoanaerobacterium sp.]|uniref:hypothetical protein n=1 Tax=Hydrogenoanaerobacterium sp. TaxID=2953763 RepID=UPI00289ED9DE|nr:hypothetical protein [Hydrogenoanaerobacterium sp.]